MKYLKYSIYFWALCDIIHLIGLGAGWMARQEFPFLYELQYAFTQASDGFDISGFYTVLFLILIDLSTFFSAYFLVKQKRFATYICLIQTVIRLFLGQSSIPIVNTVMMSSGTINPYVVGVIETFKILSIAIWHIYYIKKSTIKEYLPNLLSYLLKPKTIVIFFIANQVLSLLFFLAANISNPYQQFLGNL
jgi:hypothetical protein